jgi:hypothetical protein
MYKQKKDYIETPFNHQDIPELSTVIDPLGGSQFNQKGATLLISTLRALFFRSGFFKITFIRPIKVGAES